MRSSSNSTKRRCWCFQWSSSEHPSSSRQSSTATDSIRRRHHNLISTRTALAFASTRSSHEWGSDTHRCPHPRDSNVLDASDATERIDEATRISPRDPLASPELGAPSETTGRQTSDGPGLIRSESDCHGANCKTLVHNCLRPDRRTWCTGSPWSAVARPRCRARRSHKSGRGMHSYGMLG